MSFWNKIFKRKNKDNLETQENIEIQNKFEIENKNIKTEEENTHDNVREDEKSDSTALSNESIKNEEHSSILEEKTLKQNIHETSAENVAERNDSDENNKSIDEQNSNDKKSGVPKEDIIHNKSKKEKKVLNEKSILDVKKSIEKDKIYSTKIEKSHKNFGQRLKLIFSSKKIIDEDLFEEIEETLIENDLNVNLVMQLVEKLKEEVRLNRITDPEKLKELFAINLIELYSFSDSDQAMNINNPGVNVVYFVGVNGAGKTTTVGKLAEKYKKMGKKVMVVAADTFRAGAVAQLKEWAKRVEVECYYKQDNADPGAVVYEAIQKAESENYDIILCDTSGRLQSKDNLMQELNRIVNISKKHSEEYPHEVLLVIDGNTGQNGLLQAKAFKEKALLTGLIITKLDGTAKGGVAFSVKTQLNIPIKYIGIGEKSTDLVDFNLEEFTKSLLGEDFDRENN